MTDTDEQISVLAILEPKGTDSTMLLCSDGYWYGDKKIAQALNQVACFRHYQVQDGDPGAWAVETALAYFPGKSKTFFGLQEFDDSNAKNAEIP
ncbi:MAG: hypothetical protein ACO23H_03165 [Alphaproteobacteria bacterium]